MLIPQPESEEWRNSIMSLVKWRGLTLAIKARAQTYAAMSREVCKFRSACGTSERRTGLDACHLITTNTAGSEARNSSLVTNCNTEPYWTI